MSRDDTPGDEELVARSRSEADPEIRRRVVGELFDRHHKRVALWCLRFTGDRETAADLAQEVFLKVYRQLDAFRSDAKFSTWLYSIARNHCLNFLKSSKRRSIEEDAEISEIEDKSGQDLLRAIEDESSHRFVRRLMHSELTETERTVMTLHYGEDMPLALLTRLLKLDNRSGAKAYIVSAKRKLERALQRHNARQETMRSAALSKISAPPEGH